MRRASCAALFIILAGLVASEPWTALKAVGGTHGYFDALDARPDVIESYSLRSQAQLNQYKHANSRPASAQYLWPNDPDHRKQDAAKIVIPAEFNSLPNQMRLPFNHGTDGFLMTWDVYWTDDFIAARTGSAPGTLTNYKAFQIAADSDRRSLEVRARFQNATAGRIANVDIRPYGVLETPEGPFDRLEPMIAQFQIAPNIWTRYWVRVHPRNDGSGFWSVSLWMADESRNAVQLIDNAGMKANPTVLHWSQLWFELNTSTDPIPGRHGDLVVYARNVVILRNVTNPASLLIRPDAGVPPPPPPNTPPGTPRNLRIVP